MIKYKLDFELDDVRTTLAHRDIILGKSFLKRIYKNWYSTFIQSAEQLPEGKFVEIGSGGGFLKELFPTVITSDIQPVPHCDLQFSGEDMPFENESVSGLFMVNVFHHIPDSDKFLKETSRVLKRNGKMIMIEPANTFLGRFIYKNFHHEPFDETADWKIQSSGPLSGSNQALPYIVFLRDQKKFGQLFPELKIDSVKYHTAFLYLLSGGVSRSAFVPNFSFGFILMIEKLLSPFMPFIGLFQTIEISKK